MCVVFGCVCVHIHTNSAGVGPFLHRHTRNFNRLDCFNFVNNLANLSHKLNESGRILATELIRRMRPHILRSISSKLLPCVSGTLNITKNKPIIQIVANIPKRPYKPNASVNVEKINKTMLESILIKWTFFCEKCSSHFAPYQ